ncbi:MAG: ParB/RepB/Spo0J family partition protein [Eubacteriales bacterium]|nr:ParB/RepB/Spo0J family partition protein [Eubacteriales bacterium]
MANTGKKKGLGRGLGALLENTDIRLEEEKEKVYNIDLNQISPQPDQPRKDFKEEKLLELAESIKQDGILQPLILRKEGPASYVIIAGERRWRAARLAGLTKVPAILREQDEEASLRQALVENIQRENLNAIELAQGYQQLMDNHELTQDELSEAIGKSRSAIANTLRLNKLTPEVQQMIIDGSLSEGHGRALLVLEDPEEQLKVAETVVQRKLNVRQTEAYARMLAGRHKGEGETETPAKDSQYALSIKTVEDKLSKAVGVKVRLKDKAGKGKIEIPYRNLDELDRLIEVLAGEDD